MDAHGEIGSGTPLQDCYMKGLKPCSYPRYRWLDLCGAQSDPLHPAHYQCIHVRLMTVNNLCRCVSWMSWLLHQRLYELLFHEQCMLLLMADAGTYGNMDCPCCRYSNQRTYQHARTWDLRANQFWICRRKRVRNGNATVGAPVVDSVLIDLVNNGNLHIYVWVFLMYIWYVCTDMYT